MDEELRYTRQPFRFQFTPHVLFKTKGYVHQFSVFEDLVGFALLYIAAFYIIPQIAGALP